MNSFFTKKEIMELLLVTNAQFIWCVKKINVVPVNTKGKTHYYKLEDLISIYNFVYRRKKLMVFQS